MRDGAAGQGIVRGWLMAAFLTACYTLSIVDRQIIAFLATDLKRDLGLSDLQLGLLQGFVFSICYALASIPLGWAIDRWRRVRVLGACLLVWTGSTFACGMSVGFRSLLLARLGIGAGEAALTPGSFSLLSDMLPRRQFAAASAIYSLGAPLAVALAGLLSAVMLGSAVAGVLHLPLIGEVAAWRATFFAAAAPGLLLAVVLFVVREPQRQSSGAEAAPRASLLPFLRQHWLLLGGYALLGALAVVLFYAFNAWNPSTLARDFGWTPARIGTTLGSIGLVAGIVGMMVGGALTSWLAGRHPARILWLLAGGHAATVLCGLAILASRTGGQFLTAAAIAAAIAPTMMMVGPVLLQILTPSEVKGRITALFLLVGTGLGAGAGPTLVGALSGSIFAGGRLADALGAAAAGVGAVGCVGFLLLQPMMGAALRSRSQPDPAL